MFPSSLSYLSFPQLIGSIVFGIFVVFVAIRLWSYAYFKSKFEQYTAKLKQINKLL